MSSRESSPLFSDATPPPPTQLKSDFYHTSKHRNPTIHQFSVQQNAKAHPELVKQARLVPLRWDCEVGDTKVRDNGVWNLEETLITPEHFAQITVDDLALHNSMIASQIKKQMAQQIQQQIETFQETVYWTDSAQLDEQVPDEEDNVVIKLEIHVPPYLLKDQFEWNPSSILTPEEFAKILTTDMGLSGEFIHLISQSIREQLIHFRLQPGESLVPPLFESVIRPSTYDWEPSIEVLSEEDIERMAKEMDRTARRMRRSQRSSVVTTATPTPAFLFERSKEAEPVQYQPYRGRMPDSAEVARRSTVSRGVYSKGRA